MPDSITVRIIHVRLGSQGFRTRQLWLSTTLLEPAAYPAEQIARMYHRRWDMELCFRHMKTTMGMEELRCRTPAMAHKELLAFLIAHNFMRCLIAQAANAHQVDHTRISFKGTVDAARSFHQAMRQARSRRHAKRLQRRPSGCSAGCSKSWPSTWSHTAPAAVSPGPSNDDPNPISASPNHATNSAKSPTAARNSRKLHNAYLSAIQL